MHNSSDLSPTRRAVLGMGALVSTALVAAACDSPSTTLDASRDAGTNGPEAGAGREAGVDAGTNPDADVLNNLLAGEYRAHAAYSAGAAILMSPPMSDPLAPLAPVLLQIAAHFQAQHDAHASALVSAIMALGGTPVMMSSVTFTPPATFPMMPSIADVMKLACNLEKALAVGYNQAVGALSTPANRFLAGTIQGDDTQHFVALYSLVKGLAGPGAMLSAMAAADVVPATFVSGVGSTGMGLQAVADFTYA